MKAARQTTALASLLFLAHASAHDVKPVDIRGLDPALAHKYLPSSSNTFACLDGTKTIPFSAVNDDYCDCPDGSDEPGTAACSNSVFYCRNEGHIPGKVLSSRVNDGICDPECCDGSDEWQSGLCEDRCGAIGKEYKERTAAEAKTRKTGAKIRNSYIKWAQGEKTRLEEEIESKSAQVKEKEKEVAKAKALLEKIEVRGKEQLDKAKQSPLYTSLLTHRLALTRLRSKTSRLEDELDTLKGILEELSKGYNPNYQDMAVKAAVVGYEELYKTEETKPDEAEEEITSKELDDLEKKDLEGLLLSGLEDNEDDEDEESDILYRIDEYIPDVLYDSYESVRDLAIDWMIKIGIIGRGAKGSARSAEGPHVAAARDQHSKLSKEFNTLNGEIKSAKDTLDKMGDFYGPSGEWKKLEGVCIDTVYGDYTYELCFLGKATQKSNKDSSFNNLGYVRPSLAVEPEPTVWSGHSTGGKPRQKQAAWTTIPDRITGTGEGYSRLFPLSSTDRANRAKCWNGPMRSATVDITCGTTNAILSISEPEKCEYFFKATSPALCWPIEEEGGEAINIKEEL
ncbi:protein kinase C substrate 80K-H, partial [Tremellales sp. Uapishka_1]